MEMEIVIAHSVCWNINLICMNRKGLCRKYGMSCAYRTMYTLVWQYCITHLYWWRVWSEGWYAWISKYIKWCENRVFQKYTRQWTTYSTWWANGKSWNTLFTCHNLMSWTDFFSITGCFWSTIPHGQRSNWAESESENGINQGLRLQF